VRTNYYFGLWAAGYVPLGVKTGYISATAASPNTRRDQGRTG
jgi:hypothetical protein